MQSLKLAKTVRILTLAPVMAAAAMTLLYAVHPPIFGGIGGYVRAMLFLFVFPLLAYPLQPCLPHFRARGREGQRSLAILMAVLGYLLGTALSLLRPASWQMRTIYLSYLFSGLLVLLFNKGLRIRASGHACGVAGPVYYLILFAGWRGLCFLPLLAAAWWASLRMKRHTWRELLTGSLLPIAGLGAACLLCMPHGIL